MRSAVRTGASKMYADSLRSHILSVTIGTVSPITRTRHPPEVMTTYDLTDGSSPAAESASGASRLPSAEVVRTRLGRMFAQSIGNLARDSFDRNPSRLT